MALKRESDKSSLGINNARSIKKEKIRKSLQRVPVSVVLDLSSAMNSFISAVLFLTAPHEERSDYSIQPRSFLELSHKVGRRS